jgi:Protein of unknown function (DUF4012)
MMPPDEDSRGAHPADPSADPFASGAATPGPERAGGGRGGPPGSEAVSPEVVLWGSERKAQAAVEAPPTFRRPESRPPEPGHGSGHRRRHSTHHRRPSSYRRSRRRRSRSRSKERRPRVSFFRRWQRAWHEHPVRTRGSLALGLLLIVGVALVGDAYWQAYHVYTDVQHVIPQFQKAKDDLVHGKIPSGDQLDLITGPASAAEYDVDHARFSFRLVGSIPLLGAPVKAVTWAAAAANEDSQAVTSLQELMTSVLGSGAVQSGNLSDASLPVYHDGRIDVGLIDRLAPQISSLLQYLRAGQADIRRIPSIPFSSKVDYLKQQALQDSSKAISLVSRGLSGAKLLPGFLGADGTRTYFVALQNFVDQRATGGAVLAYAIIQLDHGRVKLVHGGGINEIDLRSGVPDFHPSPAVAWYMRATGAKFLINNSANYGPDFPQVASAWAQMVQKVTGYHVDGAMAFDPIAIKAMLQGQGQLRIPAYPVRVSAGNVVAVVSHDQFSLPRADQVALPGQLVAAAFKVLERPKNFYKLATGLGGTIPGRHIQVWAARPQEESLIDDLGWSGGLTATKGDSLALAYDKRIAGKQDYWTRQSIDYNVTVKPSGTIESNYTVHVSDDIPHQGQSGRMIPHVTPWGLNVAMLNLYVPGRAKFQSVTPDYKSFPTNFISPLRYVHYVQPKGFVQHVEGTHNVFTQTVTPYPGHPATVSFHYSVPKAILNTHAGRVYELAVDAQPLYNPATMTITVHLPPGSNVKSFGPDWEVVNGDTLRLHVPSLDHGFTTEIVF